ncbi:MAG TPA: SCO family protein [Stellaceae bacterium]|nr:SCO family protein [Stellaceae bacterium]
MQRSHLTLVGVVAVVLLAAVGYIAYQEVETNRTAATTSIGGPFELVDQTGHTVTDQSYRGKWMLIYFGYTHCPDACPTALNDMALALDGLGAKRGAVQPLFVTVDPDRDTVEVMRDYTSAFAPDIIGLTGTQQQVDQAAKQYRVYAKKHPADTAGNYDMDHSSIIYVMDPKGRFVANFTHETSPEQMSAKLKELIS